MNSFFNTNIYNNAYINNNHITKNDLLNQNNITDISNISPNKNLLEYNINGLNKYNIKLKSYKSKYNLINIILNIKNNTICNLGIIKNELLLDIENNSNKNNINNNNNNVNINIINKTNNNNNNYKINNLNLNKYLDNININNKLYTNNKNNIINYVKYIDYKNISSNNLFLSNKNLYDLLFNYFFSMNSLISKPIFEVTNDKIVIHLFMYLFLIKNKKVNINNSFVKLNKLKLNKLCQNLSNVFKKPVELDLVRLYYPYFDSNIFVNLLSKLINKIQVRIIMKQFFNKAIIINPIKSSNNNLIIKIPSLLSGINLRIGGRLMTQRLIPKQTIKTIRKGTLSKGKINFLDEARYTNKNKRGAFTLVMSIGHYLIK